MTSSSRLKVARLCVMLGVILPDVAMYALLWSVLPDSEARCIAVWVGIFSVLTAIVTGFYGYWAGVHSILDRCR